MAGEKYSDRSNCWDPQWYEKAYRYKTKFKEKHLAKK